MKQIKFLGVQKKNAKHSYSLFLCPKCYNIVKRRTDQGKVTKSCGCIRVEQNIVASRTHGDSYTHLYSRWQSMIQRCRRNIKGYENCVVCDKWQKFENFKQWMIDEGYDERFYTNYIVHRLDNADAYSPETCVVVTPIEHAIVHKNMRKKK